MSNASACCTTIKNAELLERDGSVSIHHQNIKYLSIEMFQVFKGISPQIIKKILQFRDAMPYQLIKQTDFQMPSVIVFSVAQEV